MNKNKLNIALIGAGRWGQNIIRTILKFDNINLCCVGSRNNLIKDLIPTNCKVYGDWESILKYPNLNGIIVATPPNTHYKITKSCLLMGINVLVEKPLTLDLHEAINLKQLAIKSKTLLMTEFTQVFNPKFQKLKKSLNLIGEINEIYTEASNLGPIRSDTPVLWDWGSHELSILISLLNKTPEFIKATKTNQKFNNIGDASSWEIVCSFKNNITSISRISNISPKKRKISVIGSKGIILCDDLGKYPLKFYESNKIIDVSDETGNNIKLKNAKKPLYEALLNFFNCIRNEERNHWSLDLGVEVTELLEQCSKDY